MGNKIIITGHGNFALGMMDALTKIVGTTEDVSVVTFETDKQECVFERKLRECIESISTKDEIIVLCDLVGGTPYKNAIQICMENNNRINVIGGINLPLVIEIYVQKDSSACLNTMLDDMVNSGKSGISKFELNSSMDCEEEE